MKYLTKQLRLEVSNWVGAAVEAQEGEEAADQSRERDAMDQLWDQVSDGVTSPLIQNIGRYS